MFTFGTGVGLARLTSKLEYQALEFEGWFKGRRVKEAAGWKPRPLFPWHVHQIVGREFFEWVRDKHLEWSEDTIRQEFSKRAAAMVRDVCKDYKESATVFVGGGHARYLLPAMIEQRCNLKVIHLEHTFKDWSPDIVPLIGCASP